MVSTKAVSSTVRAGTPLSEAEQASLVKLLKLNLHCPPAVLRHLEKCRFDETAATMPNQRADRYTAWKVKQWTSHGEGATVHGLDDFLKRIDDEPARRISQQVFSGDRGEVVYIFRNELGEVFSCFVTL
ncbi:hypothetical protein [Rhizobium halophytocola]|uniref:Uncharacterized protein n=1 Tax=Rhizobium halophytocola TaxID=735519 RepID=A0ABS4E629_9HYPH|nr:hypothetical protein [Rhizobium halophytocola]MBP1853371.1 hypothetical protein [Rhizobium halophytocola]